MKKKSSLWWLIPTLVVVSVLTFVIPAYADTLIRVKQASLSDHSCDSGERTFIINQIADDKPKPSSITVYYTDGTSEVVQRSKPFEANAAHYTTTNNLNKSVLDATATIYDGWKGEFVLSHGPCGSPPPTATNTKLPPTATPSRTATATTTRSRTPLPPTPTPSRTATTTATGTNVPPTATTVIQTVIATVVQTVVQTVVVDSSTTPPIIVNASPVQTRTQAAITEAAPNNGKAGYADNDDDQEPPAVPSPTDNTGNLILGIITIMVIFSLAGALVFRQRNF